MANRPQPSELTGGSGFTFEDGVSAHYLAGLLLEGSAPGLKSHIVTRVALQQAAFGEPLDDLIVDGTANDGTVARLSLQVKRSLSIGAGRTITDFREIVGNSWKTLKKQGFRTGQDRFGFAIGTMSDNRLRALQTICEWARASDDTAHFESRFSDGGLANKDHRSIRKVLETILSEAAEAAVSTEAVQSFLAHFVAIKFDALHEGATSSSAVTNQLAAALAEADRYRSDDLLNALQQIASEHSGRSAAFQRADLLKTLRGRFRLRGSHALRDDLKLLGQIAEQWPEGIGDRIGGISVPRPAIQEMLDRAVANHRFIQIQGLPGTGKSAVLRQFVERNRENGSLLFLKSDRLSGQSWPAFARSIGLTSTDIVALLAEIEALGAPYLCIDGIDRIEPAQRGIVMDLIRTILRTDALANWRIIVTARDAGIEPLRNWLPSQLFADDGLGLVEVKSFSEEETNALARAVPALRGLLFGPTNVREIARRPFFASVLARELALSGDATSFTPRSEIDLIERWWRGGGYDAQSSDARRRQRVIIDLARAACQRLGRPFSLSALNDASIEAVERLVSDGMLLDVEAGHTAKFAHDIFFEWACFHLLTDADEGWIGIISQIGEHPVLGRVVELLSQASLLTEEGWDSEVRRIETSTLRNQWLRAWLLGPFGAPDFGAHQKKFAQVIDTDDYRLLRKLLVWFQAEKTRPNEAVLAGGAVLPDLSRQELIRLADMTAWPSDMMMWSRLIRWLLSRLDELPISLVPDVVPTFEVWQNAFGDFANAISEEIVARAGAWLDDLEGVQYPEHFSIDRGQWNAIDRRDDLEALASALRGIVLKAARSYPERITSYLTKVKDTKSLRGRIFGEVMRFSPILAETHPELLADLSAVEIMEELPEDKQVRQERERKERLKLIAEIRAKPEAERTRNDEVAFWNGAIGFDSVSHHDWQQLSTANEQQVFYPPSPLREPFHSLFRHAPDIALELVRHVTNHAIIAWRQLHRLDYARRGTSIPVSLQFPWGEQQFYGNEHEYMWGRGWWGPQAIQCAMFALDAWAFSELDKGAPAEEVIEKLLRGHQSVAPIAIAIAVLIESRCATTLTLPIAVNQRLWHLDLQRLVAEQSNSRSSLIGFSLRPTERAHVDAILKSSGRPCRKIELRWMAILFVLHQDKAIRDAAQAAIRQFPDELPFAYEEQRESESYVQELRETAENWAEWGRSENYRSQQHSAEAGRRVIYLENPKSEEPKAQAVAQRHEEFSRELSLSNWVTQSFEKSALAEGMTLAHAIALAKALDRPDLFERSEGHDPTGMLAGAVVGTAAAIFCFPNEAGNAERDWAKGMLERAYSTPEAAEGWYSGSIIPWHPLLFVARALSCLLRAEPDNEDAIEMLLSLAAHPLEQVSLEATVQAIACWEVNKRLAWLALDLALRLCIGSRRGGVRSAYGYDPANEMKGRIEIAEEVVQRYVNQEGFPALTTPPPAWEFAAPRRNRGPFDDDEVEYAIEEDAEPVWREPDRIWRWDMAQKLLAAMPVAPIMLDPGLRPKFLAFVDALLDWTLARLNPSWRDDDSDYRRDRHTELYEWRRRLSHLLAHLGYHLSLDELKDRYLSRVFELEDEQCMPFLSGFVHLYACTAVLDAKQVSPEAIKVLQACLERMLKDRSFQRSSYGDGRISGFEFPELIQAFLFADIPKTDLASRFANGDWREIETVMPIVDRLVKAAGWVPLVASSFMSLCEEAAEHYSAERFADQVLAIFACAELPRSGWNDSTLPARIAGMVQSFADRDHPLQKELAQKLLRILDFLVDLGDRRSTALQISENFKNVPVAIGVPHE